jgi:hypothetical protein
MGMGEKWDEVLPGEGQALTKEDLAFWKRELNHHQGKTWKRRAQNLSLLWRCVGYRVCGIFSTAPSTTTGHEL